MSRSSFPPWIAALLIIIPADVSGQTATVYEDEVRFVFEISESEIGWICSGPLGKMQYAWLVETTPPGPVLRLGFTSWGFRSLPGTVSFPELITECGQVGAWEPEGRAWRAVPGIKVLALSPNPANGPHQLVLRITDPRVLEGLFPQRLDSAGKPVRVLFLTDGLHLQRLEREVRVRFVDRPAPPLETPSPPLIVPTR